MLKIILIKLEKLSTMKLGKKVIIAKIIERCELGVNKIKTKLLSLRINKVGRNVSFAFPIKILGGENITIGGREESRLVTMY